MHSEQGDTGVENTWLTISDPLASSTAAFGVTGTTVNGINDLGDLVGFYSDGTNVNGFLATPTPLPAALPLFATGLGALGFFGWRSKRKNAAAPAAA
jgi:hypothetical protein